MSPYYSGTTLELLTYDFDETTILGLSQYKDVVLPV